MASVASPTKNAMATIAVNSFVYHLVGYLSSKKMDMRVLAVWAWLTPLGSIPFGIQFQEKRSTGQFGVCLGFAGVCRINIVLAGYRLRGVDLLTASISPWLIGYDCGVTIRTYMCNAGQGLGVSLFS